jgi:hypothetical protein
VNQSNIGAFFIDAIKNPEARRKAALRSVGVFCPETEEEKKTATCTILKECPKCKNHTHSMKESGICYKCSRSSSKMKIKYGHFMVNPETRIVRGEVQSKYKCICGFEGVGLSYMIKTGRAICVNCGVKNGK